MKYIPILGSVILLIISIHIVHADTLNPCEYMNINATTINKLDIGNDPNFERIKQQNNQEMVRDCQEYEIKLLREKKSDLDRDNY